VTAPHELFAQPIAHRGLHDASAGVVENSRTAVLAAIEAGYGIEVDVQVTADGEAVVFHDRMLDRLTGHPGAVAQHRADELCALPLSASANGDRIWRLQELVELVDGRAPLVVEMKSLWNRQMQLATRTATILAAAPGLVAVKSFDPEMIIAVRKTAPHLPRGIIGHAFPPIDGEGRWLPSGRFCLRNLLHWPLTRPDFLSWDVHDLPRRSVQMAEHLFKVPVMTWTVRTPADQARAALYADQIVFEGFRP